MTIHFDLKKLKALLKKPRVLIAIASVCALAVFFTVFFYTRYVFDCVNVKNSVNVTNTNDITYEVYYQKSDFYPNDNKGNPLPQPMNQTYVLGLTDKILINNRCAAALNKEADNNLSCLHVITTTFVVRMQGNGKDVLLSQEEARPKLAVYENSSRMEADFFLIDPYEIRLEPFIEKFESYKAELEKESKGIKLTGELAIEFTYNIRGNEGVINSTTKRGIVIPFTSETYKIEFTGSALSVKDFPERNIRFPNLLITILCTLLTAGFAAGAIYSLRYLLSEKNPYKREVKKIVRKYGDCIAFAAPDAELPVCHTINVKAFKELIKISQTMQKSVICMQDEAFTIFYVLCDNTAYQFVIEPEKEIKPVREIEPVKELQQVKQIGIKEVVHVKEPPPKEAAKENDSTE